MAEIYDHLYDIQPLLVQIELTEACNLKCRFCYNSQKPRFNHKVFEMMDALAKQGVMQLTLTGGEPLMHPNFFEILKRAVELFPNVMILSNGALMSDENVKRICDTGPMSVSISIHGDAETHDTLTGVKGSFDASIKAIKAYLRDKRVPVASNFVLNAFNKKVLPKTAEYLQSIGLKFMTVTRFVPVGIGQSAHDLEIEKDDMIDIMRFADRFMQHNEMHIEFAEAIPFCVVPPELKHLCNTCSYGYDRFYSDVEGNLMVCGLTRIPLGGNILETPLSEIKKNSDVFNCFVKQEQLPLSCLKCSTLAVCHGGCRASAMKDNNWRGTPDSFCSK